MWGQLGSGARRRDRFRAQLELHSSDMVPEGGERRATSSEGCAHHRQGAAPARTDFRYVAIRRPIFDESTHDYLRITLFVAPFTVLIPPNDRYNLSILNIPQDDTNTMFYFIAWSDRHGIDQEEWRRFCGAQVGIDLDANFHRIRTHANNYMQDRDAMKAGSHTGIEGIPNQDIAMWETMGPITWRLGTSVAIVRFRRIMVDAARRFAMGAPPARACARRGLDGTRWSRGGRASVALRNL
jgi:phthalate 4,5-dioxygenase oxygenase subunit